MKYSQVALREILAVLMRAAGAMNAEAEAIMAARMAIRNIFFVLQVSILCAVIRMSYAQNGTLMH